LKAYLSDLGIDGGGRRIKRRSRGIGGVIL